MATNIESTCNFLLQNIRTCGLNYSCQETPYSIYVTLRKSSIKSRFSQSFSSDVNSVQQQLFSTNSEPSKIQENYDELLKKYKNLEEAFENMKNDFAEAIEECDTKTKEIEDLNNINLHEGEKIDHLKYKIDMLEDEKKTIEAKKEHLFDENEYLKKEIIEMKNKVKVSNRELKLVKKENIDMSHRFEKKIGELEHKIKNLSEFKASKAAQEKNENVKMKNLNKKLKAIEEKEAKVEIERLKLERNNNKKEIETEYKTCQTDQHPDLPLKITSPLPPIFSSQLCYASRPIHLSRSLPKLDQICWVKPEDDCYLDEAEEYLNYQYDQEVKHFYLEARMQAQEQRKATT